MRTLASGIDLSEFQNAVGRQGQNLKRDAITRKYTERIYGPVVDGLCHDALRGSG